VVYEFSDFDCSYCAKAHVALEELYRRYQGRVLFIFRPLHLRADPAAGRAVAAVYAAGEQGKFWELASALFGSASLTNDSIRAAADAVRLDWSKLQRDAASPEISEQISHAQSIAEAHHLRATPIVFINGRELDGARSVAQYESVLQEELNARR
jgi:protein-disulfide isomerase